MPDQRTHPGSLELLAREHFTRVERELGDLRPQGRGYALLVFDFGADPSLAYVSNARRDDVAAAMAQFIQRHLAGELRSVFSQERPA